MDRANNVFVTGQSGNGSVVDYATVGYSSAGMPLWTNRYDSGGTDAATAVAVDGQGNALVLAKVMLVAKDLDLGRWLQRQRLIYPILHDSLLLTALFIVFHVVEHLVIGLVEGESFAASIPHIDGGGLAGLALRCGNPFHLVDPLLRLQAHQP